MGPDPLKCILYFHIVIWIRNNTIEKGEKGRNFYFYSYAFITIHIFVFHQFRLFVVEFIYIGITSHRIACETECKNEKKIGSTFFFSLSLSLFDSANVLFPFDCLHFVSSLTFNLCLYLNTEEANDLTVRFK